MTEVADTAAPNETVAGDRTRPLGIVLLVVFQLLNVASSMAAIAGLLGPRQGTLTAVFGTETPVFNYVFVGLAVLSLAGAVALWRLNMYGWYAIMILTGLGLALQIVFYVWAAANFINMAIFVVSAFYLNQREVKEIFLVPPVEPARAVLAVEEDDRR